MIFEQISIYYLIFLYSYVALLWVAFRRTVFSLNLKKDFGFSEFKIRVMRNSTVLCGELKSFSKTCYGTRLATATTLSVYQDDFKLRLSV